MSRGRLLVLLIFLIVFWVGPMILGLVTDWLWFADLGFLAVYRTRLVTQGLLLLLGGGIALTVILGSARLADRLGRQAVGTLEFAGSASVRAMEPMIRLAILGGSAFLALMAAGTLAASWNEVLLFLRPTPFGAADPLFGRDIGFYVFTLPVYRLVQGWLVTLTMMALLAAVGVYAVRTLLPQLPSGLMDADDPRVPQTQIQLFLTPAMRAHLFGLGALVFALLAWGYRLAIFDLVYSTRGAAFGAGYTDVAARLPALWFLLVVALGGSAAMLVGARREGFRLPLAAVVVWATSAFVVGGLYPAVWQRLIVQPQELERERPFIERTIRMTREAFALDRIEETPIAGEDMVTPEAIDANPGTIGNIRLWDPEPLLTTYNQIQSIRLYYEFANVDVDRYTIDGRYRQVMLAARELVPERLPSQAQTWVNRRLQFTHGYGVAMSAVNEVTPEGLPTLFLQDVPPRGKLPVERPEIYYSERSHDYVIVRTRFPEFSYPRGEENVYTTYEGRTGVGLGSRARRALFAWRFRDVNILLSDAITRESVILYHRNIIERVGRVAPFLRLDSDPYVVVADGRLWWILDAYTTSSRYPYAQPHRDGFNYIRNSVKAVVDAYHGTVSLYVAEPDDPIIRSYGRIFPGVLRPMADLPTALRRHLRYPQDIFAAQAEMYRTFHMQDPRVFYNREDVWVLPEEIYIDRPRQMTPYYIIMRLPGAPREEFVLILPYTPPGRQNMITWLAARSDGEHYGQLKAFRYPKDKLVFGPMQIEARLNQDPAISQQFTLWSQGGNRVIRGNLIVIPIGEANLYVEPIYLQAEQGRLPEMKQVVLASGNRVVMEATVDRALRGLFADAPPPRPVVGRVTPAPQAPPDGAPPADPVALLRSLQDRHARMSEELRAIERELQRLREALERR